MRHKWAANGNAKMQKILYTITGGKETDKNHKEVTKQNLHPDSETDRWQMATKEKRKIVNRLKGCRDSLCIKDGIISLRERKPDHANLSPHHKQRSFIPTHRVSFTPARHSPKAHPSFSFFPRNFISDWGPNLQSAIDGCQRRPDGRNAGTEKQTYQSIITRFVFSM